MKNVWYILISILIITYSSCDPFPTCTENDTLPNFESLTNVTGIGFPEIVITSAALDTVYPGQEIIVDSLEQYIVMEQRQNADGTCNNCNFPTIDFNTTTLIGHAIQLGCVERLEVRMVKVGSVYEAYYKRFDDSQCASNSCSNIVTAWMTIPKLEAGETVTFNGGNFSYTCEDC